MDLYEQTIVHRGASGIRNHVTGTSWEDARLIQEHAHMGTLRLTRRQREVLHLLCLRLTDPEIADILFIGTRTVESHVASILNKLNAANRRQAAETADFLGIL